MYNLREPQQIVYDKIKKAITLGHKKILVMACTGFGKTILSHEIIKNANAKNNSVLFTSHRIALAKQTKDKFKSLDVDYLQGENNNFKHDYKCLVATIQTLNLTEIKQPKIVIIDECHYAYDSGLIQTIFDKFKGSIFICLTATPTDNNDCLLEGFDYMIDDYQTIDLIKLGWLVPFKSFAPFTAKTEQVNDEIIIKEDINNSIVENYIKYGENRKFIVFASSKKHCYDLKESFKKYGLNTEIITADTTEKQREQILIDFKNNLIHGLISIEILTAGFDEPSVSCVIMATFTDQWKKYIQCAGRGIRLFGNTLEESIENGKPYCVFLDFFGNIERHNLPETRKEFKIKQQFSRIIDKEYILNSDVNQVKKAFETITEEKKVFLKEVGKLLDLYENKVYAKESDLQEDVNNFLEKTNYFWWRQNSGKMFKDGRWVHFTSKHGLPDCTVFYNKSSLFFGLELKLPKGYLTEHQQKTLPEMVNKNVLFFICESVYHVYKAIEHIELNIIDNDELFIVKKEIYNLPEWQLMLRRKIKL